MGIVKFKRERVRKRLLMGIIVTTFLVVMVTLRFFDFSWRIEEIINPRWIVSGIIMSIFLAVAYFLSFHRMYIYAFLLTGVFNLNEEISESPGIISEAGYAYLLAALILLTIGCIYLIRFLKENPIPDEVVPNEK